MYSLFLKGPLFPSGEIGLLEPRQLAVDLADIRLGQKKILGPERALWHFIDAFEKRFYSINTQAAFERILGAGHQRVVPFAQTDHAVDRNRGAILIDELAFVFFVVPEIMMGHVNSDECAGHLVKPR